MILKAKEPTSSSFSGMGSLTVGVGYERIHSKGKNQVPALKVCWESPVSNPLPEKNLLAEMPQFQLGIIELFWSIPSNFKFLFILPI